MSENKRTPEQILEEANAFLEKAGVTATLEEFLNSDSVKSAVDHYAKQCEKEILELVNRQNDELIAKAEAAGFCDGIVEGFQQSFSGNFKIFMLLGHIEVLIAYGVEERTIFTMLSNVLINNSGIMHQLVKNVCYIQWDHFYTLAQKWFKKLDSGEEEVSEPQPVTCETCGETGCLYDEDCRKLGFCLKGKEFHCNGKGRGECNCPCADSCEPRAGFFPCVNLDFTVIPPEGGCCECGTK